MPIRLLKCLSVVLMLLASGCHTTQKNNMDPYEGYNRVMFGINKGFDTVLIKPISYVYIKYLPYPIQYGIGNFFDNMREVTNVANDLLQFQFAYMMHDTSRFLINSTIGIFGFFDPAASLGLEHRKEDFGQTLYHWGYEESAYIILPFIGPSTIRDSIGLGVDFYALSIWPWINSDWRYAMLAADYVDIRARILRKESVLDVVTIDEYVFMRNAYFQHRKFLFEGGDEDGTDEEEGVNDSFNDIFKADKTNKTKVAVEANTIQTDEAKKGKEAKTANNKTTKTSKTKLSQEKEIKKDNAKPTSDKEAAPAKENAPLQSTNTSAHLGS